MMCRSFDKNNKNKKSNLGLLLAESDPVQPPGDESGGAGAVGGAGHGVGPVGGEGGAGGGDADHQGEHCHQVRIFIRNRNIFTITYPPHTTTSESYTFLTLSTMEYNKP